MSDRIIVSRHRAAVEFIARELGGRYLPDASAVMIRWFRGHVVVTHRVDPASPSGQCGQTVWTEMIEVVDHADAGRVRGKIVYGNLPLHLAALAHEVVVVEFAGAPPRGQEYTLADMDAAGARLVRYVVRPVGLCGQDGCVLTAGHADPCVAMESSL
ncbi:MAG TPA: CRISPR-associated protein Csx16 [Gemmataceae bacterium]|jgi:hypothetical protein|nr:CRISPR-associated protein Csx16 [Gemmataceae bacterium]